MICSMTGFAEARRTHDGVAYGLEVRSLNHRYFKASIKLPENLQFLEVEVERTLRQRLGRGSVNLTVRARSESSERAAAINEAVLATYLERLGAVQLPPGMQATVDLASLLAAPGVCETPEADETQREALGKLLSDAVAEALDLLIEMRLLEGRALSKVILADCENVDRVVDRIEKRAPVVLTEYQRRLQERVSALLAESKLELDGDGLLREIAIYADRCDISEELARLRSHAEQFVALCNGHEQVGRKLDFLTQELLREANTIGSKSNDSEIAHSVVELKALIDRLKEQVQNVA